MDFLTLFWDKLLNSFSYIFHILLFTLPLGYVSLIIRKRGGKNADKNGLIFMFLSGFIIAPGATVYLHIFNPQAKEIFYAKLFTYPALELKFDLPDNVSNVDRLQIIRALVKEFPNSEFKSPARIYKFKNDPSGIRSSAKYIPNYWKIKNNSFYYYFGNPSTQQKFDAMEKDLNIRFSNPKPLISNKITLKRHDETFPVQFYFKTMNKGILPNETEVLTHTIKLHSFDIKHYQKKSITNDIKFNCVVRFAIDDQYWTKKIHAFQKFLKTDKVARSAFAISKENTDDEINNIASQFIMRLNHSVTFSNKLTYPAKVFIDSNGYSNVVATLNQDQDAGYLTERRCHDLAYEAFPSLMPIYVKKTLLVYIPEELEIKKVTARKLRFSPFYSAVNPVSGTE